MRTRLSLVSGEGSGNSPIGLIGAVILHGAIIVATLFSWEHRLDIAQESPPIVPIDLVTLAQKTNIAPTVTAPKMEPLPVPQQAPPELRAQTPPLPEKSELAPQPEVKPAPKPQPEKPKDDKLADILKQLTTPQPEKKASKDKLADILKQYATPQQNAKVSDRVHAGAGAQNAMTADLRTILYNEIHPCWDVGALAGAPNPEQLVVYIDLVLNPDGTVAGTPQLTAQSQAAAARNPFVQATASAALRAIHRCQPFKLPVDRYGEWRTVTMRFSPQDFDQ